ncbi:hypothetical protein, partial [Roseisolibacter sp. H3M3-2]|uniref:hypothetical protein n=1 Tax=Roseisolibacter sp. H3M3-2 TaxID=3031323 RepID=UPI0023D9B372
PAPRSAATAVADLAAARASSPSDVSVLAERWDRVVEFARAARPLIGSALGDALPIAVAATGAVTIELQESNAAYVQALEMARDDVLAAVRQAHPGATRVIVRAPEGGAPPTERLTTETVRAERMTALGKRDPVLGAAIDALDLDLME